MGVSTVSLVLKETVQILRDVLQSLNMSQPTVETFKKTAAKYHSIWKFSQCLGAVDGKHARIICPAHTDTKYTSIASLTIPFYSQRRRMLLMNLRLLMLVVTTCTVTETHPAPRACFKWWETRTSTHRLTNVYHVPISACHMYLLQTRNTHCLIIYSNHIVVKILIQMMFTSTNSYTNVVKQLNVSLACFIQRAYVETTEGNRRQKIWKPHVSCKTWLLKKDEWKAIWKTLLYSRLKCFSSACATYRSKYSNSHDDQRCYQSVCLYQSNCSFVNCFIKSTFKVCSTDCSFK